jgi:sigma-B regulation protein RsbU (phosphoserine phosphatase)
MNRFFTALRRSLSARLSFAVVLFVAAIFVGAFGIMFSEARDLVSEKAWGKATKTLEGTVLHIDNTLRHIEVSSDNMLAVIERNLEKPDSMFSISRQVLINNPELSGCSISFDPFYYKEKGRYFSAYSYNNGDTILTEQEGTDNYQYHCMDWYLIPKLLDRPYWIEPFLENATEGIIVKDIFSSYSRPIHDTKGNSVGTFSVDIRLEWFTRMIAKAKPYPHSFCVMLGKGGTFLVHPDSTKLFYETIFTRTLEEPDSVKTAIGTSMLAGESGHKIVNYEGELCHIFYKPFKNTGWSVAIVIPESDILAPYYRLRGYTLWISATGLLLLLLFSLVTIRKSLKPLQKLAETTGRISEGDFSVTVADGPRVDEIGQLQRSFTIMQQSLNSYTNELRSETTTLKERHKELLEAYEHAKEDERMKTAVLHKMPDKMAAPVAKILTTAQQVCDQMNTLDISEATNTLRDNAEQITTLLDEMIRAAQEERRQAYEK